MPRTEMIYQVFIASPEDVKEEREILEDVIEELNRTHSSRLGIRFDLIRWETNTYPSIDTDAQAAINSQIGEDYDIFIGILWKKIGTPTPRAESGTIEEFKIAYRRYKENKEDLKILFYFKDAPFSRNEVDPSQLIAINEFQNHLSEIGIYYRDFKSRDEFEKLIRMNLMLLMQDMAKKANTYQSILPEVEKPQTDKFEVDKDIKIEEEGFLDLLEIGEERFADVGRVAERMAEAIKILGDKATMRSEEIKNSSTPSSYNAKVVKRAGDHLAEDMDRFVTIMNTEIEQFSELYSEGIDAYGRAFALSSDFSKIDVQDLLSSLNSTKTLKKNMLESTKSVSELRDIISNSPRLTTSFVRAKRRTTTVLDDLIRHMDIAGNLTSEMEKIIEKEIKDREALKGDT